MWRDQFVYLFYHLERKKKSPTISFEGLGLGHDIGSSSSSSALGDRDRFLSAKCEETYETLTKYRSVWGKRER